MPDFLHHLTGHRPWNEPEVLGYLNEQSGKHFDPDLVELFLSQPAHFRDVFTAHPDTFAPEELP